MSPAPIGIQVGPKHLRALRLRKRHAADAMDVEWDTATPDDTVAALVERFGSGNRLAVAVDTSTLFLKRIALPEVPPAERRQIVTLDPERFFPLRDEPLVVGLGDDDLVVAARAADFDRMTDALQRLGAVERVEPTPFALARHVRAAGVADGWILLADQHDPGCALCRLEGGRVASVRKLPLSPSELASMVGPDGHGTLLLYPWQPAVAERLTEAGLTPAPVPAPAGSTESFAGAHGALLGVESTDAPVLVSTTLERRRSIRAWQRGAGVITLLVAAMAAAAWSFDHRRQRTLREVEHHVAELQARAGAVESLRAQAATLEAEVAALTAVSQARPDPLEVLLLLTRLLPPDAFLRSLHASGGDWELDGYARDAATLIPTLEASELLADVRFRSATTRIQISGRDYESYALAFRFTRPTE